MIEGADIFPRLFRPESADPGNGEENGSGTNDPGAGEPGTGNSAAAGEEECRPDAIICTGRSDYPNQVNNVLCFPFIFRGALDVGATAINEEMKLAAVRAIAELAHAEQSEVVASAYGDRDCDFGPEYIIPKPFDPRLIVKIAPAVAKAAMESGVAVRPIIGFSVYIDKLTEFVYKTNLFMKPIFSQARKAPDMALFQPASVLSCHSGTGNAGTGETDPYRSSERDRNAHSETGLADQSGR